MTVDPRALLAAARAEREGLGRMIQYAPPESWEGPSRCAGWTNRQVLAHLAAQDAAAARLVAGEPAEELDAFVEGLRGEPFSVDAFNAYAVERREDRNARAVILEWGRAADRLLGLVARIPTEEWAERRVPWLAGRIPLPYLVQSRIVEWWLHGEDMRAGAAMEPRIVHEPIFLLNDLAIRMLPWALGIAGLSFQGKSIAVDLEGAGGGSWHYGLAPREQPPENKKPDAFVEGRGEAFAMVAGLRVAAERYLDDGNLVVGGGDPELAIIVLRHIRAYP